MEQGRMEEAKTHLQGALAVHREVGNRRNEGVVLGNLGILHQEQGRMEEAKAHLQGALAVHREVGNRHFEGYLLGQLARVHALQGDLQLATALLDRGETLAREVGAPDVIIEILSVRAEVAWRGGDPDAALTRDVLAGARSVETVGNAETAREIARVQALPDGAGS